jgi:hypothetical protein
LRGRIALAVVRTADPDKVLGENPLIEGMHIYSCVSLNSRDLHPIRLLLSLLKYSLEVLTSQRDAVPEENDLATIG